MDAAEGEALERTFRAIADATRRHIWEILGQQPGATTAELVAAHPALSRWAVMKHLTVLRQAGLIQTLPRGRQRCHFRVERGLGAAVAWLEHHAAAPGA
ncbi:MAG TPA: hypothetical protein VJZ50_05920 [Candidatus Limnocylindrales bacterium]|nr:hypothetical protein [Candidatus Limnocylindrales bacterium]